MLKQSGNTVDKGGFVASKTSKLLATSNQFLYQLQYIFPKKKLTLLFFYQ